MKALRFLERWKIENIRTEFIGAKPRKGIKAEKILQFLDENEVWQDVPLVQDEESLKKARKELP